MKTDLKETFLSRFPIFRDERPDLLDRLIESCASIAFDAGTSLYEAGAECSGIGFFLSGEIRVFKIGGNGREITLYEIFPGETCMLNAACLLSNQHYPANATAISTGTMMVLSANLFMALMQQSEIMRRFIFALFSQRYCEMIELLEGVVFGRLSERLNEYLVEKSSDGCLHTSHQRIANDLGTSREVVSRLLKESERRGDIAMSRNQIRLIRL